ncbi:MAG: hypothetical protein RL681_379 [Candidatus Parcubacteria bacterium]|jgi:hypothetical protein
MTMTPDGIVQRSRIKIAVFLAFAHTVEFLSVPWGWARAVIRRMRDIYDLARKIGNVRGRIG